jgi:putative intracellular protease/amidase
MRRSARILALLSAFSTTLLGVSLLSVSLAHDAWSGVSLAASADDFDTAAEAGGESFEDEREEESEPKTHLLPGRSAAETRAAVCRGTAALKSARLPPRRHHQVVPIRGPPSA